MHNDAQRGSFGLDDDDGIEDIDLAIISGSTQEINVSREDLDKSNTSGSFTRTKTGGNKAKKNRRKRVSRVRSPYNAQQNVRARKAVKEIFQEIGVETDLLDAEVFERALLAFAEQQGLDGQATELKTAITISGA